MTSDDELQIHDVLDGLIVFDACRNRVHHLNTAGAAIFDAARNSSGEKQDGGLLVEESLAPRKEIEQFLAVLAREELIDADVDENTNDPRPWTIVGPSEEVRTTTGSRYRKPLIGSYTITSRKKEPPYSAVLLPDSEFVAEGIHINDFLYFEGGDFVTVAYQWLLGRDPDPEGYTYYLGRLESGETSREIILKEIRNSEEGQWYDIRVEGL